jgi:hypothetical protein
MSDKRPSREFTDKTLNALMTKNRPRIKIPRRYRWNAVIAAAIIIALLLTTVSAVAVYTFNFMKPGEIFAGREGYDELNAAFEREGVIEINESITSGAYTFTLLAIMSGEDLLDKPYARSDAQADRTYVAAAIGFADGTPIESYEQLHSQGVNFFYNSPLVKGLNPWLFNVATLSGGGPGTIIDGVAYYLVECDNFEIFADRGIYFLICGGGSPFLLDAIIYDEQTGEIRANPDYDGVCAIFELPIDKSRANPEKAEEYLHSIGYYWTPPETTEAQVNEYITMVTPDEGELSSQSGETYSGSLPRNWNEWSNLSEKDQKNLISRINWNQADFYGFMSQELFVDENGMITYSTIYSYKEFYVSVPFDGLFEDNKTAQSKIVNCQIVENDNALDAYGIRITIDRTGKITGSSVWLYCPQIDFIPSTYEEFRAMSLEDQIKLQGSLDWNKGVPNEKSFRECTVDKNGMVNYSWRVYDENGAIAGGGDSRTSFSQLFEDNQTAQSVARGGSIGGTDDGSLKFLAKRFSMDENGKITAVELEMVYPFAFKQLFHGGVK